MTDKIPNQYKATIVYVSSKSQVADAVEPGNPYRIPFRLTTIVGYSKDRSHSELGICLGREILITYDDSHSVISVTLLAKVNRNMWQKIIHYFKER